MNALVFDLKVVVIDGPLNLLTSHFTRQASCGFAEFLMWLTENPKNTSVSDQVLFSVHLYECSEEPFYGFMAQPRKDWVKEPFYRGIKMVSWMIILWLPRKSQKTLKY